jgi:molybdopterin molybdotransferase
VRRAEPIELERARELILSRAAALAAERVALHDALGLYLAEDIVAPEPVPAFDNSAMDGFALRAGDTRGASRGAPALLRIAGESRAGSPAAAALEVGEAMRISTGAAMPAGADAVIRVEATREEDGRVEIGEELAPGRDVRRAGEDVEPGQRVLRRGTRIGAAELGVLASAGAAVVACHRRARVRVLTSGDELLEPDEEMRPGGVRNSNAYSIPALAEAAGAEATLAGLAADDPAATRAAIAPALDSADVVVLCGGVSVGAHDHVKGAFAELGVEESFWGVKLKPGKPTWFGTRGETLVFGLPGNPVSAMVTFLLLVRPALAALGGGKPQSWRTRARLASHCHQQPGRTQAVRCGLELHEDGWHAHPFERQGSHVLTSMLGADCLALLPPGDDSLAAGQRVEVELLDLGWAR